MTHFSAYLSRVNNRGGNRKVIAVVICMRLLLVLQVLNLRISTWDSASLLF